MTANDGDILAQLRNLDLRLHIVELYISRMQRRGLPVPGLKRPRGRPRGSKNVPKVRVGEAAFEENRMSAEQLAALSLVGTWVKLSAPRRRAPVLSAVLDDPKAWAPPAVGSRDPRGRAFASLVSLRSYASACNEMAALGQVLRHVEGLPVDDPQALKRGLDLVVELTQSQPPSFSSAA